jgi:serine/threonine-protein kinase RsbW
VLGRAVPVTPIATICWSVPATAAAVGDLRTAVCAFASDAGLPDPPLADVRLAVSEAVTNVVLHGYRDDAEPGPVEIDAELDEHELRLVVADRGVGMQPRGHSPGAGFGLPLIAAIADAHEIRARRPHGTELHLSFRVSG